MHLSSFFRSASLAIIALMCSVLSSAMAQQTEGDKNAATQQRLLQSQAFPHQQLPQTPPQVVQGTSMSAPLAQVASAPQTSQRQVDPTTDPQRGQIGPPFQITPVEKQFVDQILQMWENESSKVNTFNSRFERWEYDFVFGPGTEIPVTKSMGQLTYSKPDKGSFKIDEINRWTKKNPAQESSKPGDWLPQKNEVGEHWVCDGKSVYEYNHKKKQLVETPLPPEMQGKDIVNGPLPFLFGAKADDLNRRYWIRSKQGNPEKIWLEAYPRTQADAANYHHVEVILDRKTMQPEAIKVHAPNNQSNAVYMFDKPTVNGKLNALFGSLFSAPRTPFGWKKVVQKLPTGPPTGPNPQAATPQTTSHR